MDALGEQQQQLKGVHQGAAAKADNQGAAGKEDVITEQHIFGEEQLKQAERMMLLFTYADI